MVNINMVDMDMNMVDTHMVDTDMMDTEVNILQGGVTIFPRFMFTAHIFPSEFRTVEYCLVAISLLSLILLIPGMT